MVKEQKDKNEGNNAGHQEGTPSWPILESLSEDKFLMQFSCSEKLPENALHKFSWNAYYDLCSNFFVSVD